MALNIMSNLDTDQIIQSILNNDENFFSSISGVGNKLALRIINELKSKAKKLNYKEDILRLSLQKTILVILFHV